MPATKPPPLGAIRAGLPVEHQARAIAQLQALRLISTQGKSPHLLVSHLSSPLPAVTGCRIYSERSG